MNSSFKGSMIKTLSPEDIRQFIASKSIELDDKTKHKIDAAFKSNTQCSKMNRLIMELNTAKQICNLMPGLTKAQRNELSLLVKQEKEYKQRHQQKQAQHEDYKNFIAVQRKILPLEQTIMWWNSNHETLQNDEFWKKLNATTKAQSKNHKESESTKRKRLHKLVDIKEDYNNYQIDYAYSSEDLDNMYHQFVIPLEAIVKNLMAHHAKQKKPYHAAIVEYLSLFSRALEEEKRLMIYSMTYRLKCADYFNNNNCDDLMAYTLSRVYHHANIPKQDDKKITPAKRSGLTPDRIKLFCKLIQEYAKSHPDDALIQSKLEELSDYFNPSKQASDKKLKRTDSVEPVQASAQNPATTLTQHHSDLGHLILSIEDIVNTINNDSINAGNLNEFLAQYEAIILTTTEQLLASNSPAFDFKTLLLCSSALYRFLCPHIKTMILMANKNEIETNPHWYHLANHLGSHSNMKDLAESVSTQETSSQFKEMLRFSTHFAQVKKQLNHSIKSSLLKEANIHLTPNNSESLSLFLQSQTLSNQQLLDFWSACAKKLKTNHVISSYDPLYALKMTKYLTQASELICDRSQEDHTLREKLIRMLPILNSIRTDINTCLKKQARSQQFHYLFSGQMNADAILKPVINIIDRILTLQLKYKLESYIKNYANDEAKLTILMSLRNKLNEVIDGRKSSQSLPDTIDTIVKEAANNKTANSHPFNKSLQNFATLSKRYFAGDNERIFTKHPEKICSLLG